MAEATLKQIAESFRKDGESLSQFAAEWKALPEEDKAQLREGIGNGTLNY